ncbi:hypothetical protein [Labedella endophytica]|uniref:DUF559 domain-containing protein n=1 Tax=Labedella endophytica TaxID=1523160 RepID=A0A433JSD0_9MICO|nr:hypothetical protein [Labedella endophytica]RUR01288.1 hypothetical protein ELQ94_07195 [Labedella endophytica]
MTDNVYSHHAAAALWRIPLLGAWPMKVDVVGQRESGGRSSEQIRRRAGAHDMEVCTIDDLRVTSPAQTAADLARILPRIEAVAAIDSACWRGRSGPRASVEHVRAIIDRNAEDRGGQRATDAVTFATDLAESVWETASRVVIEELGFPRPVLQQSFRWSASSTYRVDFWWPEQGIIGEFDGLVKYAPAAGVDPRDTLIREKVREDRLRSMASGFVRWTASDVRDAERFVRLLSAAGLPRTPPRHAYANAIRA